METIRLKRLRPEARLPIKATAGSAGFDLFACLPDESGITLTAHPVLVGTGVALEVPVGYEAQVRPRSGLSKRGVGVTFGTIDSDYRGELLVTMYLFSPGAEHSVHHGDRIAQLIINKIPEFQIEEVQELSETERGAGGHGSTGV